VTLVVGGTGQGGSRVAARLSQRGVRTRIATRSSRPRFDWQDDASWPSALDGVAAAFLSYHPDIGDPSAAEDIGSFATQAVARGGLDDRAVQLVRTELHRRLPDRPAPHR
jgi:uncharacterized protein YbjT (DUF2867 family)